MAAAGGGDGDGDGVGFGFAPATPAGAATRLPAAATSSAAFVVPLTTGHLRGCLAVRGTAQRASGPCTDRTAERFTTVTKLTLASPAQHPATAKHPGPSGTRRGTGADPWGRAAPTAATAAAPRHDGPQPPQRGRGSAQQGPGHRRRRRVRDDHRPPKELIINAAGNNMPPSNIENAVLAASLLGAPCRGDRPPRHYLTAPIPTRPDAAAPFAAQHGIADLAPPSWPINRELQGGAHKAQNGQYERDRAPRRRSPQPRNRRSGRRPPRLNVTSRDKPCSWPTRRSALAHRRLDLARIGE